MLYLAIDHHKSHLLVRVVNDAGTCVRQARVSTRPPDVDQFLSWIAAESAEQDGFLAMVEECGFTLWLEQKLAEYGCRNVVKIQPLRRQALKTDKRDAASIAELLWTNRARVLADQPLMQVRRVRSPCEADRRREC